MHYDKVKHKKFYKRLNKFCVQAITGTYMALYRTIPDSAICEHKMLALINNNNVVLPILTKYLNDCWKSYHTQDDQFVVRSVNKILDLGLMTHPSCVFHWISNTCLEMMKYLMMYSQIHPIKEMDVTLLREILRCILTEGAKFNMQLQLEKEETIKCGENCKVYHYKEGEDFVIVGS